MRFKLLIPARYQSSRLPGKPLVMLRGKSMIQRCWERCVEAVPAADVIVATDDTRIAEHCRERGISCVMTPEECLTGTDRIAVAAQQFPADYYISVQGDEPLFNPADITRIREIAVAHPDWILNGLCPIGNPADYASVKIPKMVCRPDGRLLYGSRSPIPGSKRPGAQPAFRQVCIYGFPPEPLQSYAAAGAKTPLEALEDIEILRFLEMGYDVHMVPLSEVSYSVDVPEDIAVVERILAAEER